MHTISAGVLPCASGLQVLMVCCTSHMALADICKVFGFVMQLLHISSSRSTCCRTRGGGVDLRTVFLCVNMKGQQ